MRQPKRTRPEEASFNKLSAPQMTADATYVKHNFIKSRAESCSTMQPMRTARRLLQPGRTAGRFCTRSSAAAASRTQARAAEAALDGSAAGQPPVQADRGMSIIQLSHSSTLTKTMAVALPKPTSPQQAPEEDAPAVRAIGELVLGRLVKRYKRFLADVQVKRSS
jgi:hypothetical protein